MHRLSRLVAVTLLLALTIVVGAGSAGAAGSNARGQQEAGSFASPAVELHLLALLNDDRAAHHLTPLTLSPTISTVARDHSRDMAVHGYFGHVDQSGHDPFQRLKAARIRFGTAAENLGRVDGDPALAAVQALETLMMSEPAGQFNHRWIILDPNVHRVGIGVYVLPGNHSYLTEDFIN